MTFRNACTTRLVAVLLVPLLMLPMLPARGFAQAPPPAGNDWPREFQSGSITFTVYQPQIESWKSRDLSGRAAFVWEVELPAGGKIGTWDVELAPVFFEAFARGAQCNLHVVLHRGEILHHIVEISFKALARALRDAVRIEPRAQGVPSTKGTLQD